jgi:hypothetical protein
MDKLIGYIAEDVKALHSKIDRLEPILHRNTVSLEEHMRRSAALEALVIPIQKDRERFWAIVKFVGWFFGAVVAVLGVAKTSGLF